MAQATTTARQVDGHDSPGQTLPQEVERRQPR